MDEGKLSNRAWCDECGAVMECSYCQSKSIEKLFTLAEVEAREDAAWEACWKLAMSISQGLPSPGYLSVGEWRESLKGKKNEL
jgi:hypothetical protein